MLQGCGQWKLLTWLSCVPWGVILDGKGEAEELGDQQAEQHREPCEVITWMAGVLRPV